MIGDATYVSICRSRIYTTSWKITKAVMNRERGPASLYHEVAIKVENRTAVPSHELVQCGLPRSPSSRRQDGRAFDFG